MCFHGNQLSWAIKHPIISLCLKYPSPGFICFPTILAPVISSLDEIYCISLARYLLKLKLYDALGHVRSNFAVKGVHRRSWTTYTPIVRAKFHAVVGRP